MTFDYMNSQWPLFFTVFLFIFITWPFGSSLVIFAQCFVSNTSSIAITVKLSQRILFHSFIEIKLANATGSFSSVCVISSSYLLVPLVDCRRFRAHGCRWFRTQLSSTLRVFCSLWEVLSSYLSSCPLTSVIVNCWCWWMGLFSLFNCACDSFFATRCVFVHILWGACFH